LQDLIKTNNQILGLSDYNLWFLETFMWFYDYNIVNAMFEKHGMPLEMCKVFHSLKKCNDTGIFEILLYNSYLHANKEKYGYKFKDVEIIFNKYLEEDLRFQYLKEFNLNFKGCCGVLEHFMLFLNKKNTASFAKIIKEMKLTIFRCEHSNDNYFEQISLLRKYSPNILAASQEHKFGLNSNNMLSIILDIAVLRKISSTVKDFVKPLINTVKWIFKPLRLVYLILRLLIKCFINTIRYFS
jgi:hypothetical protein